MERVETIILGAGLAGLSTALHLERDWLLVEKEDRVGGLTRTEELDGYHFDQTGHWLHLRHPHIRATVERLMGDGLTRVRRRSHIWSHGRYSLYPFQGNLYGLPREVVEECLMGVIEAKLQSARAEGGGAAAPAPRHFLDYVERHFGKGIARHFMVPYNTKLWGVPPTEITADWCSRFVPYPSLEQVVSGALGPGEEDMGYNAHFVYPKQGGIETLVRHLVPELEGRGEIALGTQPVRIDTRARRVELSDGRRVAYEHLVSSVPLGELVPLLVDAPDEALRWVAKLRWTSLRYINLGFATEKAPFGGTHWIYVPEPKYLFYRLGCFSNAVPSLAPDGRASCYVEIANTHQASDEEVMDSLRGFLHETGAIDEDGQIEVAAFRTIPHAYVIFDHHYFPARETLLTLLGERGVRSIGRYGSWVYASMEDALQDGYLAAGAIRGRSQSEEGEST